MNPDQVLPQVVVGACPETAADIDQLQEEFAVSAVLNLQTDGDLDYLNIAWPGLEDHYRRSAIELRRVPVRDFDRDDLRENLPECVRVLGELMDDGHIVYVHCTAGLGRSPSVVAAYLHWVEKWDLGEAVAHVNRCHPASPDTQAIRLAGEDLAS